MNPNSNISISIVVPLFNEEETIDSLFHRLNEVCETVFNRFQELTELVFVNDGSKDSTLLLLHNLKKGKFPIVIVNLTRNFGHQAAVLAGLSSSSGNKAIMVIDGDLQDPPELLLDMYENLIEDVEVVYAVRKNRKESIILVSLYSLFYKILNKLTDGLVPRDSGDFALMSRRVVDLLIQFPERQKFIRGLRAWVGFKQIPFYYNRDERQNGVSKYSLKALLKLAKSGIFNFTDKPLILINNMGLISILLGVFYFVIILFKRLIGIHVVDGFTSTVALFVFFTGIQLFSLGIIAEYISRIFLEVKNRPIYLVESLMRV